MNLIRKSMLAGAAICAAGISAHAATKPNVLMIVTDDENYDTLSCYGGNVSTPNIDSIAKNGIRFTNMNVVHSVCSPSRYAIMTGRYYENCYAPEFLKKFPEGKPVWVGNSVWLEGDKMNIAGVLKNNGYQTGFVGKFHNTEHRYLNTSRDWEKYGDLKSYPRDSNPKLNKDTNAKMKANHKWWVNRLKKFGYDYVNGVYPANLRESFNKFVNAHNVEWTVDCAKKFLDKQKGNKKPFFLYVATTYPHGPAPEIVRKKKFVYSLDNDVQLTGEGYVTDRDLTKNMPPRSKFKKIYQRTREEARDATAQWWDAGVGAIIKSLKKSGQYENTIIIYISDHGKYKHRKGTLYEYGIRVPFMIQWPAKIKAGQVYDHVAGSVDVTPSVFDFTGVKKPADYKMDGKSFASVINNGKAYRDALLLELGYAHGIKTDKWKYIAVRYTEEIEKKIQNGHKFPDYRSDAKITQPYLFAHRQLSKRAAAHSKNYFMRNQLYDYRNDIEDDHNLYGKNKAVDKEMKALLAREEKALFPNHPFGEFNTDSKAFDHLKEVIWYPESSKDLKVGMPVPNKKPWKGNKLMKNKNNH